MRSINEFRANLTGGGARPNLFRVILNFPTLAVPGNASVLSSFMCQSASLPSDKIGEISVGFMGRKTYWPGDREFEPWTITVINDENFDLRDVFERWLSAINSHEGNVRNPLASTTAGYTVDMFIQQLSKIDGPAIKQYKFVGTFPTDIGAIELSWSENNSIETFPVTLRYQYWNAVSTSGPSTDGDAGPING